MASIQLINKFEPSQLIYEEPRKLETGGKMVYVKYNDSPLKIQTPTCYAPFGINVYKNEDSNTESHSLDISFDGYKEEGQIQTFFNKMQALDDQNTSKGFQYQQAWFRKNYPSEEVIKALYTNIVKFPKDKNGDINTKWSPTFKIKLPRKNGKYDFEMFDAKNNKVDPENVQTKGAKMIAIVKCTGIWMAGGKFGMTWKAEQIKIYPPNRIQGYCIRIQPEDMIDQIDESALSDDELNAPVEVMKTLKISKEVDEVPVATSSDKTILSESDDEELEPEPISEPDSVPQPVPEVVPEPVAEQEPEKKVVKKVVKRVTKKASVTIE